jgi:hypothetical protein
MPDYRAYIVGIDSPFDSVRTEFLYNHPDDATAIEAAKQLAHGHDIELLGPRQIRGSILPGSEVRPPQLAASFITRNRVLAPFHSIIR